MFSTVSDLMTKNFSSDWKSPVSDTIKDILEERGQDYEQFIVDIAYTIGWRYSCDTIKEILDGKRDMTFSVAKAVSNKLGSTVEFWLRRSGKDYPSSIDDEMKVVLLRVLQECLLSQVKQRDVTYEAELHLNTAIALLAKMVPDYEPSNDVMKSALEWAKKEIMLLECGSITGG
jgi:hypothetical protein